MKHKTIVRQVSRFPAGRYVAFQYACTSCTAAGRPVSTQAKARAQGLVHTAKNAK